MKWQCEVWLLDGDADWLRRLSSTPWRLNSLRERWRLIDDQTPARCKWLFSLQLYVCVCKRVNEFQHMDLLYLCAQCVSKWVTVCVCVYLQYFHRGWTRDFKDLERSHSAQSLSYWPQVDRRTEKHALYHQDESVDTIHTHGEQSPSTMSSLNCCEIQIHPQQTLLHTDLFYLTVLLADFSLHINNRKWHFKSKVKAKKENNRITMKYNDPKAESQCD